MTTPSLVALIPARAGSVRVPGKNIRTLADHPLIAYTIAAARESGIFDAIVVSTDSEEYATIARHYGAEVPFLRPPEMASSTSADFEWIDFTLRRLAEDGRAFDCFSILRPTSPLRQADTIRRAWEAFRSDLDIDSLRAVELCKQHPGKMWIIEGEHMRPLLDQPRDGQPWHSQQYAALPQVYVQNASLEIAWTRVPLEGGNIAGDTVMPFLTTDLEGFDVNDERDWRDLDALVSDGTAALPRVSASAFGG